jgi:hypothetical protein
MGRDRSGFPKQGARCDNSRVGAIGNRNGLCPEETKSI